MTELLVTEIGALLDAKSGHFAVSCLLKFSTPAELFMTMLFEAEAKAKPDKTKR